MKSLATLLLCATTLATPNILLIFVDDMGYGDLGCYGSDSIRTPHIDRLASEGQRWTTFYASGSTCVPSRTGLMSGRHPTLLGKTKLAKHPELLMPAMLKGAGYSCGIIGKWHLAGYPKDFTSSPMHPLECGFDFHYGTPGSNDVPAPPGKRQNRAVFDSCTKFDFPVPLIHGRRVIEHPVNQELLTARYTEQAVGFIKTKREQPFFLYLAHNMPHAPIFAAPAFQGKSKGGRYGDVIEEIDWSVGQVLAALKEVGQEDNTLVIFTSDNGPWSMFEVHGGTTGPLRGEKGTSWEGGFRVPGIFRWPGKIKPGIVTDMAANLDLYATFATLANGTQPSQLPGYMSKDLSGVLLRGEPSPRRQWLFAGGALAFRSGAYKIHLSTKTHSSDPDTRKRVPAVNHRPPLLFNVESDIGEQTDIGASHPELVQRLAKELASFRSRK
jgi:arylsulfatase A-like enzyme